MGLTAASDADDDVIVLIFSFSSSSSRHMALVDPADPARIMDAVVACGVRHQIAEPLSHVQAILTTHYVCAEQARQQ